MQLNSYSSYQTFQMNSYKRNNSTLKLIFLILSISYQTTHLKFKIHLKILQIKFILLICFILFFSLHIMISFCFSIFIMSLWQLCRLLFSVHSKIKSSSVYRDKNSPLIYGPIVFSLTFWIKSPSMFKMPKHPSSITDLNSNRAVISRFDSETHNEVGPNLPLNWWKTLN